MEESGKNLCICGGGSLGTVIAGTASARGFRVSLLSERAEQWHDEITVHACDGTIFSGKLSRKSASAKDVIPESDFVLLCVPGYLIRATLEKIAPHLRAGTSVGSVVSSTGFFFLAPEILPAGTPLFGLQRVPYIARVSDYGRFAELLGYKSEIRLATRDFPDDFSRDAFRQKIETLFETPTVLLKSYWDAALTNSNPLLHPCRLYGMWKDWDGKTPYSEHTLFYEDWDDFSSEVLIAADEEFFALLKKLPVTPGAIPRLLDYYECGNASELTRKLKSIPAFRKIRAPMLAVPGGFIPDVKNRYFTEDIPFGLKIIKQLSEQNNVKTPVIENVLRWGEQLLPPPPSLFYLQINEKNQPTVIYFAKPCASTRPERNAA